MKYQNTEFEGLIILEPEIFLDERGYFYESYNQSKFEKIIKSKVNFCQDNQSLSNLNVIRGLHYQKKPIEQSKLVRVLNGSVLDVVVDLRKSSLTFGKHFKIILSAENKLQLFIPKGFAHGFKSLDNETVLSYKVDNFYSPEYDDCILFNDSDLSIDWEVSEENLLVSKKDLSGKTFSQFIYENN